MASSPLPKTTTPGNIDGPRKTTTTKPKATGVVLEVSDPTDLWYLCEKVGFATLNPFFRSDGQPMYQRVVTQLIRLDCKFFDYHFPYAGEVGYDMTQSPPAPIMSQRQPNRPSSFPLSQYRAIKQEHLAQMFQGWLAVEKELMTLEELEDTLKPNARSTRPQPVIDGKGLIRIPDVVRVKNFAMGGGVAQFSQGNLHMVIEVKFKGDTLSIEQQRAYEEIAGNPNNFRLLNSETCDGRKSRTREWIRASSKEPVYVPVSKAMKLAAQRRNGLAFIPEYQLLVQQIDEEHEEVRRTITPQPVPAGTPQMTAAPSAEEQRLRDASAARARAGIEMTLAAPFVAAAGVAVTASPILFGGAGAAEPLIAAQASAKVLQFPKVLRPLAAATATAATSYKLAAQPLPEQPLKLEPLPTAYVFWPD